MHQAKIALLALYFRELQKMPMRRASHLVVKQFQLKGGAAPGLKKDKESTHDFFHGFQFLGFADHRVRCRSKELNFFPYKFEPQAKRLSFPKTSFTAKLTA